MTKGVIESCTLSKSGKSYSVIISGKKFSAKLDSRLNDNVGRTIDFDTEESDFTGKDGKKVTMNWVTTWGLDTTQPAVSPLGVPAKAQATGADRFYMNFVSNVVAHAIQVGKIDDPSKIGPWARAAYKVALDLDRAAEARVDKPEAGIPGVDQDVPF